MDGQILKVDYRRGQKMKSKLKLKGKNAKKMRVSYDIKTLKLGNKLVIPLFGSHKSRLLNLIEKGKNEKIWIATVNPEFLMAAAKDESFLKLLQQDTTYNVVDGIGLVWQTKINDQCQMSKSKLRRLEAAIRIGKEILNGKYREEVIAGSDLIDNLCDWAAESEKNVFFLGGFNGAGLKTAEFFQKNYPQLKTVGWYEGMAEGEDEMTQNYIERWLKENKQQRIDILLVAYGMKRQEEWIKRNWSWLPIGVAMGVGRSFDYYSGQLKRAPLAWRKMGLEWLYSLIQEPKRWRRQLALPKFIWQVVKG